MTWKFIRSITGRMTFLITCAGTLAVLAALPLNYDVIARDLLGLSHPPSQPEPARQAAEDMAQKLEAARIKAQTEHDADPKSYRESYLGAKARKLAEARKFLEAAYGEGTYVLKDANGTELGTASVAIRGDAAGFLFWISSGPVTAQLSYAGRMATIDVEHTRAGSYVLYFSPEQLRDAEFLFLKIGEGGKHRVKIEMIAPSTVSRDYFRRYRDAFTLVQTADAR